jgi:hypothetical protein
MSLDICGELAAVIQSVQCQGNVFQFEARAGSGRLGRKLGSSPKDPLSGFLGLVRSGSKAPSGRRRKLP